MNFFERAMLIRERQEDRAYFLTHLQNWVRLEAAPGFQIEEYLDKHLPNASPADRSDVEVELRRMGYQPTKYGRYYGEIEKRFETWLAGADSECRYTLGEILESMYPGCDPDCLKAVKERVTPLLRARGWVSMTGFWRHPKSPLKRRGRPVSRRPVRGPQIVFQAHDDEQARRWKLAASQSKMPLSAWIRLVLDDRLEESDPRRGSEDDLSLTCTAAQRARWRQAAKTAGKSLSAWLREAADRSLDDRTSFSDD